MSQRLKVLLVTDEMEVGGTQRQILHLARNIDRQGFELGVIYFRNRSAVVDELEAAGARVVQVAKRRRVDPGFVLRLARTLRRERPDLVHCFSFSGELWGAVALLLARSRTPLISSVRATYRWYSRAQWLLKRWVTRRSLCVVSNSRTGAEYAERKIGLAKGTIRVVYNGVESASAAATVTRDALGVREGAVLCLFVGRIVAAKNLLSLLRAAALLPPDKFVLLVAGSGPGEAELLRMIDVLGLGPRVRLLGQRDDAPSLIRASDIVVLPSLFDGLSNVLLEAMAAGKPLVASDAGGNPELVADGRNGFLYPSGDEQALARSLRQLMDDEPLRRRLGEEGRRRAAAEFAISTMVRSLESLYREAVWGGAHRAPT